MAALGAFRTLSRHEDVRHLSLAGIGAVASPLLNFAFLPFVLRQYDPQEYGIWALVMSAALLIGNISTLRIELAVVLAKTDREAGMVYGTSILLAAATAGILLVLSALRSLWSGLLPNFYGEAAQVYAIPALVLLISTYRVSTTICTRTKSFGLSSGAMAALAVGTNVIQLLAPRFGMHGAAGLITGSVGGYLIASAVIVASVAPRVDREFWRGAMAPAPRRILRRYENFPRYSVPYNFVSTLRLEGGKLLLGVMAAPALVGAYAFAYRVTNFIVTIFAGSIRPVLFNRATSAASIRDVHPFIERLMLLLSLAAAPVIVVALANLNPILGLLGGEKWTTGLPFVRVLLVPAYYMMVTSWIDRLFDVLERQRLALVLQAAFSTASLVALWLGYRSTGGAVVGVAAQSMVLTAYFVAQVYAAYVIAGFCRRNLVLVFGIPLLVAAVSVAMQELGSQFVNPWAGAALALCCGWAISGQVMRWFVRRSRPDSTADGQAP